MFQNKYLKRLYAMIIRYALYFIFIYGIVSFGCMTSLALTPQPETLKKNQPVPVRP